jgi:hypothetical protein
MASARIRRSAARRKPVSLLADLGTLGRDLIKGVLDPYRPERHYMRGPGPKWHAKHSPAAAEHDFAAVPALAPVRVKR